jgi:hypothetical protein
VKTSTKRWLTVVGATALGATLLPITGAASFPVSQNAAQYSACGRVFPDPQAFWPSSAQAPKQSPWAKGNGQCRASDFIGWDEALGGLDFMASPDMFGDFVEVYNLGEDDGLEFTTEGEFADILDEASGEGMTAGLPTEDLDREKVPMYMVRVTDEESSELAIPEREHFVYTLSIHGIERAGIEGGLRAAEDLATWASCEKHDDEESAANCARENAGPENPHPILETLPEESITAGEALRRTSVWFVLSNPDGWRRGDKQEGGFFYQRYNGNGMDMNRDWPAQGYTFRPYTPWSEPETRATGKALQAVKDKWTGGIDLHGQLIDRAFSFTLIGGNQRPYDKDRRVVQFTKGAWADAEERLAWSATIKPNDAPESDPRVYGVQWGTIWDTIDYTVTGAAGDWIDSPLGLDADGIDNEMSLSHLSNCGVGTCFLPEAEQLHVDGNKSLIYAMIHYSLLPEDTTFGYSGRAAYLHNPDRVSHPGSTESTAPEFTELPPQEAEEFTMNHVAGDTVHEFEVQGPEEGFYNGGIRATITWSNAQAVSLGALNEIAIDQYRPEEENPDHGQLSDDEWQVANSYFNQSFIYAQSGAQIDVNSPTPGRYRVRVTGDSPSQFHVKLEFLEEQAWPDPGQVPYDVSNMDFFDMLSQHVPSADKLVKVSAADVLAGTVDLSTFDTVVAADEAFLPGFRDEREGTAAQETVTGTATVPGPGAGVRSRATSGYFEFDVPEAQGALDATVRSTTVVDPDLYLQVQQEDGSWSEDLAEGETGRTGLETLSSTDVAPGRYRLEVHNWAGAPGTANIEIAFQGIEAVTNDSAYSPADRDQMAGTIASFARGGGNVVLTDNSLRALEWMGLTPPDSVREQKVYAGHVQFSADGGETTTYDDPLAANVDQPGAAEGSGHRHQIAEPVPTGYAIQDASGGDMDTHPQWSVDRAAYEAAGGRVVGTVGDGVTFGEIGVGNGVVRILGSLLPMPTEEYDHPYGLASYGVTYSGYEVTRNLLDWTRPIDRGCIPERVPDSGFTDTAGNTHETNIECIAWYGITVGTSETTYSPAEDVTRGQMASFIARLAVEGGLELPSDPADAFGDDDGNLHEGNINALAEMGLVKGKGPGRYDPAAPVSRAQMASFIARVHEATTGSLPGGGRDHFPDDDGNVHESNINALAELGVVRGRDGKYFPDQAVSRAQMASFVMHDLGLQIAAGVAYFGGASVALDSAEAADGAVSGTVETNKELRSLVADGCGLQEQEVSVADDGSFTVELAQDQAGQCALALTATTGRPSTTGTEQAVTWEFTVTVA